MLDAVRLSFLEHLVNEDDSRASQYVAYRQYYDGDHDTQLTARQRAYLQIKMGEEFNDNLCPIVVDALVERLTVTGFDCGDDEGLSELLWDWWTQNRMDATQGVTHTAAVRDGDGYLIVGFDNDEGRPTFTFEPAYDGIEGVKVHYSKERRGEIAFASKRWRTESEDPASAGKVRRLNLYFPDRIEKYYSADNEYEGNWQEYQEEGEAWPLSWVDESGQPLGVPVIHLRNRDQGYNYGKSELKDVIPLQNALNKSIIDLLAAADTAGFPLFVMLGDDPTGLQTAPGSWIYSLHPPTGDTGVSVSKIPAEDLAPLIQHKDSFVLDVARVSRTPLSYFQSSGMRPAEGTLKQEESGLVARAKNRQVTFGNAWEDALRLAVRLFNTFGGGGLDADATISAMWDDPQTRNEKEHLETLQIKRALGVPEETLWAEMGYNAAEIADMRVQRTEEMSELSNIGGSLLQQFEGGGQRIEQNDED